MPFLTAARRHSSLAWSSRSRCSRRFTLRVGMMGLPDSTLAGLAIVDIPNSRPHPIPLPYPFMKLGLLLLLPALAAAQDFDLLIRNGRIVDGAGNPTYTGDI